ncbi:DUF2637 domain-containing protein [Actinacidiphila sp. DG2A-62]|uniref:DUF2637 domain-containing protein n=1 Tax=Actinacidiphila sp. DG2A-62 TaxID=3108821 RepID=UPI002DB63D06|nr:DUF2637 domain-containing protein [Actinacidiphila sp. DG2A-62]MEC3998012.1 DUF2637 domain-containing protein [Actinacidiphila sp. DG2A-62]
MARIPRVDPILIQAVIAGSLSFAHLHDIADAAGQTGWKAWAYPISVDLLLVAAWHRMRALRAAGHPARAAWTWFVIALAASLGANVATAGLLDMHHVPAVLRVLVAGWPALAFFGGSLLAHSLPAPVSVNDATASDTPADPDPITLDRTPAMVPASGPVPVPELPSAPAPAPVPAALVAHARKIADAYHAQTGRPIDTATLRTRLGVPPALADAIAAHLT